MAEQQHLTLPPSLMRAIKSITSDEDVAPGYRIEAVLILISGYAWFVRQDEVDPRAVALPQKQWLEVAEMLTSGVVLDSLAGINLGIRFMNQGPSSF